jgi:beta-mannanase
MASVSEDSNAMAEISDDEEEESDAMASVSEDSNAMAEISDDEEEESDAMASVSEDSNAMAEISDDEEEKSNAGTAVGNSPQQFLELNQVNLRSNMRKVNHSDAVVQNFTYRTPPSSIHTSSAASPGRKKLPVSSSNGWVDDDNN